MPYLEITANGSLVLTHREADGSVSPRNRAIPDANVTAQAACHLMRTVRLAPDCTVGSVLRLIERCGTLAQVFAHYAPARILAEAFGPEPAYSISGGIDPQDVEVATLYRVVDLNSTTGEVDGVHNVGLHGVGRVLTEPYPSAQEPMYAPGSRVYYGFELTSVRHLVNLPLRFDTELEVCEADSSIENFWERGHKFQCSEFLLGEVLDAVLDNVGVYGPAEDEDFPPCAMDGSH